MKTKVKRVLVISGFSNSGKDAFIDYIELLSNDKNIPFYRLSSIDPVLYVTNYLLNINGIDLDKTPVKRMMLSDIKDIWIKYYNGPFNYIKNTIDLIKLNNEQYIITVIIREYSEIKKVLDYYTESFSIYLSRRSCEEPKELLEKHTWKNIEQLSSIKINNDKDLYHLSNEANRIFDLIINNVML